MKKLYSRYLKADVELSEQREEHIVEGHPDLLPKYWAEMKKTVEEPDEVRKSARMPSARLHTRWFNSVKDGKYVVVVIVTDSKPTAKHRYWIVTAYIARKIVEGEIEWQRKRN